MATMTLADRAELSRDYQSSVSHSEGGGGVAGMTKADYRAVVDAVDQWVSDNSAGFNAALPQPFRTNATAGQKAYALMLVIERRFLKGA